jgi:regulator of cell morphogenesis and NO signaling
LRKAEVFRRHGIDFCCGGKRSLQEACEDAGVDIEAIKQELEQLGQPHPSPDKDYNNWDLDFLADYIVQVHHKYVTGSLEALTDLSQKVTHRHGGAHPELQELKRHVVALLTEMRSHQIKEERVLFPFIRQLAQCLREHKKAGNPPFGTVESPVQMMIDDHATAAAHVREIERLTSGYQVPSDGCDRYRLYFAKLQEFNKDLEVHLHLENNILFPKAVELEKELIS